MEFTYHCRNHTMEFSCEFDQFISGGYYLVAPVKRHDSFSMLLPPTIVTLSSCIAEVTPLSDEWGSTALEEAARPSDVVLLGIGLHTSLTPLLNEQRNRDVNHGYDLIERIGQRQRLSAGKVLGFEPLGFYAMSFHSWLCNYFPDSASRDLNIQPAANGFIRDFSDALRVTEYIGKANGEPAIWLP